MIAFLHTGPELVLETLSFAFSFLSRSVSEQHR
jgi:hypothetical protein